MPSIFHLSCKTAALAVSLLLTSAAWADNQTTILADAGNYHGASIVLPLGASAPYTCVNSVSICGQNVFVQPSSLGTSVALTVPSPYLHQPFTVQCAAVNGTLGYVITNASAVTCALQSCEPSSVTVCGVQIPVPGGTTIGNSLDVPVPGSVLTTPPAYGLPTFTAQCIDGGDAPVYQLTDTSRVSCNQFPCQAATIELCDVSIPIAGGAPLGAVRHFAMPPPFANDPFTVECIGNEGNAPTYQLIEHDAVTCTRAAH